MENFAKELPDHGKTTGKNEQVFLAISVDISKLIPYESHVKTSGINEKVVESFLEKLPDECSEGGTNFEETSGLRPGGILEEIPRKLSLEFPMDFL